MPEKKKYHKSLKIIFLLKNRKKYILQYLKQIKKHPQNYDLLILYEKNIQLERHISKKIFYYKVKKKIKGMNSIFSSMYDAKDFIRKYKYVCFVEDDNFIFNKGIIKCEKFLESNRDYIGCNGNSFLFQNINKRKYFINSYISPFFTNENIIDRIIQYNKMMGLTYYSLIKTKLFILICKKIKDIKDDNLSEIFFNYLLIIYGKLKKINIVYLARKYPRPKIYNIPKLDKWIAGNHLVKDINYIIRSITQELKNSHKINVTDIFLKNSIFYYLSIRLNPKNKKIDLITRINMKLNFYYLKFHIDCIKFVNYL